MIRTIGWFLYFFLYQFISLFFLIQYYILGLIGKKEIQQKYLYNITSIWARQMVKAAGGTVEVIGTENIPQNQNVLFVSNHQGNFDIPIFIGFVPTLKGFVAKEELGKMPILSTWMRLMHCIFLNRKDTRRALQSINLGIQYLKEGKNLVIFPEGTRSKGNPMREFKKGSLKLAIKAGVPVVPVTINGSYKLLEEKGFEITPGHVKIIIHAPIHVKELSNEDKNNLAQIVQQQITIGLE